VEGIDRKDIDIDMVEDMTTEVVEREHEGRGVGEALDW
jgi:hypothetical protein